jgi:hypothetical protein
MEPWRTSLVIAGSLLAGSSLLLKTLFLYVHMWQRGTRHKTVMRFMAFELMLLVSWWFFYEPEGMSRGAVLFQRVVTVGIYLGGALVLVALWKEVF